MEDKDVEELLKKAADQIDPGDFSARYKAIGHKLKKKKTKKFDLKIFIPTASLSIILVALVILPFAVTSMKQPASPPQETYFVDDLLYRYVGEAEFYGEMAKVNYECADLSMENAGNYRLIVTESSKTKGGAIEYIDDSEHSEKYISIKFYDTAVKLHEYLYADYDLRCEVGGASIKYKLLQHVVEDGVEGFEYVAHATYKGLTYLIDYVSLKDDVTDLFDYMFA